MNTHDYGVHFESYLLTEKRVAKNTCDAYRRDLAQFFDFITRHSYDLSSITSKELKEFLKELHSQGLTARSISRKISCLKSFFNYLTERHGFTNHGQALLFPKLEKNLPQFLNQDDVSKLITSARAGTSDIDIRNYVMLYLMYATGMRISELLELTAASFEFDSGYVKVAGKGGKDRLVPLPHEAQDLVKDYLENVYPKMLAKVDSYRSEKHTKSVFPTLYNGVLKSMSRQAFWAYIKELAEQAGITSPLFPHQIRHSLATHLLEKGANLRSIQLMLGHENLKTVQVYTHIETAHLRRIYDKFHPRA